MCVEAGTGLGSHTRQITMTDNLGTGEHLMKDGQQVSQPLSLGRRTGVARQSVLVQPTYKAAFLHDKAIALHGMKSGECYEVMQKAIDMHNKNDIKELWRKELKAWKAEE